MALQIRPADLKIDRELLIDVLYRYLTPLSDGRRFDWLYQESPHGPARVWVAVDRDTGAVVGASAIFPRRMYAGGMETSGGVLGDFCIQPHYRSLGPALQLQRASLQAAQSAGLLFTYDFPSASMLAVYKRLGVELQQKMIRLAKPLRADRKIAEILGGGPLARVLTVLANRVIDWRDRGLKVEDGWVIALAGATCGEEFSTLAQEVSGRYGVCVERSAEYLNWRYLAHPFRRHEILTARRQGRLGGYVTFTQNGEDADIVDLFGLYETEVFTNLLAGVVAILRQRGVVTISASVLATHPLVKWLEDLGFRRRESRPVMVQSPDRFQASPGTRRNQSWFLMGGDWET